MLVFLVWIQSCLLQSNQDNILSNEDPQVVFDYLTSVDNVDLKIKNKIFTIKVANSEIDKKVGLMYRTQLPPQSGMLFVFDYPQTLRFWMKNTFIDLGIMYLDQYLVIQEIHFLPPQSLNKAVSMKPMSYALELSREDIQKYNIKIGDKVSVLKEISTPVQNIIN